jgi:cell division septation protein DedD
MKNSILCIVVLLLFFVSCDKTEPFHGYVGKPVHLAPVVETLEDTLACSYEWSFVEKPKGSNMDVLSFQPSSRSFGISFVPDMVGEYVVAYSITDPGGRLKTEAELVCSITEDTTTAPIEEQGYALSEEALEAPPPVYEDKPVVSAPAAPPQAKKPAYKPPVKTSPAKKVLSGPRGQQIEAVPGKFTIQISAWHTYAGAERAVSKLESLGLDVYIQKAYFVETDETWYRVRTGNFSSREAAKSVMRELKSKLPYEDLWIDSVRKD